MVTGTKVTTEQFLEYLTAVRDSLSRGGSWEGSLRYELAEEPGVVVVAAMCRVGQEDGGQGGALVLHGDVRFPADVLEEQIQRTRGEGVDSRDWAQPHPGGTA